MRTGHIMTFASRGLGKLHRWRGVVSRAGLVRLQFGRRRCQWGLIGAGEFSSLKHGRLMLTML